MKYLITVLISCIISITSVFSEPIHLDVGSIKNDSIYALENLRLEYSLFQAQSDDEKFEVLMKKVKLSLQAEDFSKTNHELQRIDLLPLAVHINHFYYDSMATWLFNAQLYSACFEILQKDTLRIPSEHKAFMKSLCINQMGDFELLVKEIRLAAVLFKKDTLQIFNALRNYDIIETEKKSVLYQKLLPGAGMIREGELKEGFTSFLLNGLFVALPVIFIQHKFYFTAFSYGLMPLTKFYSGGIKHTKYLASTNAIKRQEEIMQQNADLLYLFFNQ